MKNALGLILLVFSLAGFAHEAEQDYPASCDGRDLRALSRNFIYRFDSKSDCEEALRQSFQNQGRFCDNTKLLRHDGIVLGGFAFSSECTDALAQIFYSRHGLFCNRRNISQIDRGVLTTFALSTDCQAGLEQARKHKGLFCNKNLMYNAKGEILGTYRLSVDCEENLPEEAEYYYFIF